jgi:hypothetical protein
LFPIFAGKIKEASNRDFFGVTVGSEGSFSDAQKSGFCSHSTACSRTILNANLNGRITVDAREKDYSENDDRFT